MLTTLIVAAVVSAVMVAGAATYHATDGFGAGNKVKDIRSLDLYAKPEENRIYFVINGEFTSNFEF